MRRIAVILLWILTVVSGPLAVLYAHPARAVELQADRDNWITTYYPDDPADPDDAFQVQFQLSQRLNLYTLRLGEHELADINLAYTQRSRGWVDRDSAPFTHDFQPSAYLTRDVLGAPVSYGWVHGSTGVAEGDFVSGPEGDSRSWDRQYLETDLEGEVGPVAWGARLRLWWAFDVGYASEAILESRQWSGRFGGEGELRLAVADLLELTVEGRRNGVGLRLAGDFLPGNDVWLVVSGWLGEGASLIEGDRYTRALGVGISVAR